MSEDMLRVLLGGATASAGGWTAAGETTGSAGAVVGAAGAAGAITGSDGVLTVAGVAGMAAAAGAATVATAGTGVLTVSAGAVTGAAAGAIASAASAVLGGMTVSEVVLPITAGVAAVAKQCSEIMFSSATAKLFSAAPELTATVAFWPIILT